MFRRLFQKNVENVNILPRQGLRRRHEVKEEGGREGRYDMANFTRVYHTSSSDQLLHEVAATLILCDIGYSFLGTDRVLSSATIL